ncbi:hypothetical protein ACI78Q_07775 [Geodermatophilus sp. SYSU D00705]
MAAAPIRPPWFGNRGLQVVAAGALAYSLVQLVLHLVDGRGGEAFLSFAWCVLFGYVLVESLRFRRQQDAARDEPAEPGD